MDVQGGYACIFWKPFLRSIEAGFCNERRILQHLSMSTSFAQFAPLQAQKLAKFRTILLLPFLNFLANLNEISGYCVLYVLQINLISSLFPLILMKCCRDFAKFKVLQKMQSYHLEVQKVVKDSVIRESF